MTEPSDVFSEVDEGQFRARLARRFEAAEALLRFAWANLPSDQLSSDDAFTVIVAIFARSTYTYRGVQRLCGLGYAPQADMLCRSLFEDMVTAHWASLPAHRDEVLARVRAQHDHNRLLFSDIAKKHEWLAEVVADAVDLEERRDELNTMFGRYGDKSWTGLTLYKLVEEVEELWPDEEGRHDLWSAFDVGHRLNNQAVHTTAAAIQRGAWVWTHEDGTGTGSFPAGPTEDEEAAASALSGAYWTYAQMVGLLLSEQGIGHEEFNEVFAAGVRTYSDLEPAELRDAGRNDPCPCGSGEKFKRCHGS